MKNKQIWKIVFSTLFTFPGYLLSSASTMLWCHICVFLQRDKKNDRGHYLYSFNSTIKLCRLESRWFFINAKFSWKATKQYIFELCNAFPPIFGTYSRSNFGKAVVNKLCLENCTTPVLNYLDIAIYCGKYSNNESGARRSDSQWVQMTQTCRK